MCLSESLGWMEGHRGHCCGSRARPLAVTRPNPKNTRSVQPSHATAAPQVGFGECDSQGQNERKHSEMSSGRRTASTR